MDETIKDIRAHLRAAGSRRSGPIRLRGDIVGLVEEMAPTFGFAPSLRLGAGLGAEVSPQVAEHALAALREALSNAAGRRARQVDVTVDVDAEGILAVVVTDNGTGVPPGARRSGLRNLAARAAALGGELRLGPADASALEDPDSAVGPGTRLEWRVPRR